MPTGVGHHAVQAAKVVNGLLHRRIHLHQGAGCQGACWQAPGAAPSCPHTFVLTCLGMWLTALHTNSLPW